MAYVSKEFKKERAAVLKPIMKKYGMKATFAVKNYSTLVINIKSGKLDILGNWKYSEGKKIDYRQVNEHRVEENYSGAVRDFLKEVVAAAKGPGYFVEDDIMTDYFDVRFYDGSAKLDWQASKTIEARESVDLNS
jgi:hypothetical protein